MIPVRSSIPYSSSCRLARAAPGAGTSVVWLRGEHDTSTAAALSDVVTRAVALNEPAVVIDVSGVRFMSAAAVGVIVGARELLRSQARTMTLRRAPSCVRRVFGVCGLSDLLDPALGDAAPGEADDLAKPAMPSVRMLVVGDQVRPEGPVRARG